MKFISYVLPTEIKLYPTFDDQMKNSFDNGKTATATANSTNDRHTKFTYRKGGPGDKFITCQKCSTKKGHVEAFGGVVTQMNVKLLPLPQPPVCARTDARTNPSAQRATQLRSVLARVYAVSIQNQITTTVP
jgi:hypothetical protein